MNQIFRSLLIFFLLGCANKSNPPPLFILSLLGQGENVGTSNPSLSPGETSSPTPSQEVASPEPGGSPSSEPVAVSLETIPRGHSSGICSAHGGLLLSYSSAGKRTCRLANLSAGCVSSALDIQGTPRTADPRTYVGLSFPQDLVVERLLFPSSGASRTFCFPRENPPNPQSVTMFAYRNRSCTGSNCVYPQNCPVPLDSNQENCTDRLALAGQTEFFLPKEFPVVTADGAGNADGHDLDLRFRDANGRYITCVYFGNWFNNTAGFVRNSFVSSPASETRWKGNCLVCATKYCSSTTPKAEITEVLPIASLLGTKQTATSVILVRVNNGTSGKKTTVSWTIQGFQPLAPTLDLGALTAYTQGSSEHLGVGLALLMVFLGLGLGYLLKKRSQLRT